MFLFHFVLLETIQSVSALNRACTNFHSSQHTERKHMRSGPLLGGLGPLSQQRPLVSYLKLPNLKAD